MASCVILLIALIWTSEASRTACCALPMPLGAPLRVATYNPDCYSSFRLEKFKVFAWGWQAGISSNKSAGVIIALGPRLGFFLNKGNKKDDMKGLRLMHLFANFWRAFFASMLHDHARKDTVSWPNWSHAYLPRRRREAPTLTLRILAARLVGLRQSFVACFKDMSNAFACTCDSDRREVVAELIPDNSTTAEAGDTSYSTVHLPGHDGDVFFIPKVGNCIGCAVVFFPELITSTSENGGRAEQPDEQQIRETTL